MAKIALTFTSRFVDQDLQPLPSGSYRIVAQDAARQVVLTGRLSQGELSRKVSVDERLAQGSFSLEIKVGNEWVPVLGSSPVVNGAVGFGSILMLPQALTVDTGKVAGLGLKDALSMLTGFNERISTECSARVASDQQLATAKQESVDWQKLAEQHQVRIAELETTLKSTSATLGAARTQVEALTKQIEAQSIVQPVPIESLWSDVSNQLRKTAQELKASQAPLKLGRVTMEMKAIALQDETGIKLGLPGIDQMKRLPTGSLSTMTYEFLPTEPPIEAPKPGHVPRLLGYTEPMAKRVLASAGYYADVAFAATADETNVGRVVRQEPPPQSELDPGEVVVIFIGKRIT